MILFDEVAQATATVAATSTTFISNLSPPVHRWFRYTAGFSAEWVREVITDEQANGRRRVLDPFAGSGTTLLEAEQCGVDAIGILPDRTKAKVADPFRIFSAKVHQMAEDMSVRQHLHLGPPAQLRRADARTCESVPDAWAELIITSPPYANNYDYADATRLELSFFGHIKGWGDLQEYVRQHLVRSCSQHVGGIVRDTNKLVENPAVEVIANELRDVVQALLVERENHGGKKNYHTMIAAYFNDMAHVWTSLRRVMAPGGRVCFVIGDSAPYGIHVPVDQWLGRLALEAGFTSYRFEKTRDRNIKWENRKHRVPLHEGRLWVEG